MNDVDTMSWENSCTGKIKVCFKGIIITNFVQEAKNGIAFVH
jgi:hypothetical protein